MIQTQKKTIDGKEFSVTQLPARRAIKLKARLIKLFGPSFAQLFLSSTENGSDEQKKLDLVKAIEILSSSIDPNTLENLIVDMLEGVRADGVELTPQIIDIEFAGDMSTLYQLLIFVIEVNFANFFSLLGIGSLSASPTPQVMAQSTKRTFAKT